jgi:leucyl-tRNA synthetase
VLQVNGKVRGSLQLPAGADRATIEASAIAAPEVLRLAQGASPKRIVIVPGRLVNVVL